MTGRLTPGEWRALAGMAGAVIGLHPQDEEWLSSRAPSTTDSGGNRLFRFRDLEGNTIEVCVEPG